MDSYPLNSELLAAILPYHWVFAFFGLAPPPIFTMSSTDKQTPNWCLYLVYVLYSIALLLISAWSAHIQSATVFVLATYKDIDNISFVMSFVGYTSICALQLVMQLNVCFGYRLLCGIFQQVAKLEQEIRWCCMQHNASIRWSFRWFLAARSGVNLLLLLVVLPNIYIYLMADNSPLIDKLLGVFFALLLRVKGIEYCVAVQLVHELLHELYEDLLQLRCEIMRRDRRSNRRLLYEGLQLNQQLLARIWNLVNDIENYFAVPMLVLFLYDGFIITHMLKFAYLAMGDGYNRCRMAYIAIVTLNMLVRCWLSQSCIDTYNQFGIVFHNTRYLGTDVALDMRLREYSLQLMHQKMIFTCGGFFDINLKNFGSMVLAISMYVIILLQFRLQRDAAMAQLSRNVEALK